MTESGQLVTVFTHPRDWAWRIRTPAILVLLAAGFLSRSVAGLVKPDSQFGALLLPAVSLPVSLILFEGGLSLEFRELREVGRLVIGLLTVGAAATWLLTTLAATWLLGILLPDALLLGAILVVTGPAVIGPLLRDIRPTNRVRSIRAGKGS